ncbi:MAG: BlaI/MecI/CopY family transcriptional regulator [Planctomycetaceae bacterium]|jgi:predicted transcriptional regulator|nr:BlaI/MecI/CopY family transcriptional regulator [Planctomycetaceae bacterium]
MSNPSAELGRAEWAVMEALWSRENSTATQLQHDLESQHHWAYSTVKTMLDRLVAKGFVKARRIGNVYEYTPNVHRRSVVARAVDDLFDRVLAGSLTPMLDRLIESRRLSSAEIDELRQMLDQYCDDAESGS